MEKVKFSSVGVVGEIETTGEKVQEMLSDPFSFHYIPNCRVTNEEGEVFVIEDPRIQTPCSINYPRSRLNPNSDSRSFVIVGEYLMERRRQDQKGIYSISSSSVYRRERAILFFGGATNLGKSSCALELAENEFDLFSDEKTLVDLENRVLAGGSRSIPLRKDVIKAKFRDEEDFKGIDYDDAVTPQVEFLVLPHLDHGLSEPIADKFEPLDLFWLLTKEFSRRIRGDTKFINYFEYLLPSIETNELAQKRIALTKDFTRNIEGYYFQGSPEQLVRFVEERF